MTRVRHLVALLAFGGVNFFSKPERFIVYFDESIHGLDLGSPVKLRGVRVGRVVDFGLRYMPERNKSVVAVVCELTRNVVTDAQGNPIDVSDRRQLQGLVDHGLRAQLEVLDLGARRRPAALDRARFEHLAPDADDRASLDDQLVDAVPEREAQPAG